MTIKDQDKWLLYYMERGQKDLLGTYNNEHPVCIEFLKVMGHEDKQLQKYLSQAQP